MHCTLGVLLILIQLCFGQKKDGKLLLISVRPIYITRGASFTITCQSYRRVYGYEITFKRDDRQIFILKTNSKTKVFELQDPNRNIFNNVKPKKHNVKKTNSFVHLTATHADDNDSGEFNCTTFGFQRRNPVSSTQFIYVGDKPSNLELTFKRGQEGVSVETTQFSKDDIVFYICSCSLNSKNATLKLYFNNKLLKQLRGGDVSTNIQKLEVEVILKKPELYDGYKVKCVAKNPFGKLKTEKILTVKYHLTKELIFANDVKKLSFVINPGIPIKCKAFGNPKPKSKWVNVDRNVFDLISGVPDIIIGKTLLHATGVATCQAIQDSRNISKMFVITIDEFANRRSLNYGFMFGMLFVVFFLLGCFILSWWNSRQKEQSSPEELITKKKPKKPPTLPWTKSENVGLKSEKPSEIQFMDSFSVDKTVKLSEELEDAIQNKEKLSWILSQVNKRLAESERRLADSSNFHKSGVMEKERNIKNQCKIKINELETDIETVESEIEKLQNEMQQINSTKIGTEYEHTQNETETDSLLHNDDCATLELDQDSQQAKIFSLYHDDTLGKLTVELDIAIQTKDSVNRLLRQLQDRRHLAEERLADERNAHKKEVLQKELIVKEKCEDKINKLEQDLNTAEIDIESLRLQIQSSLPKSLKLSSELRSTQV